jgi:methyl-accepting chemotaxis protein
MIFSDPAAAGSAALTAAQARTAVLFARLNWAHPLLVGLIAAATGAPLWLSAGLSAALAVVASLSARIAGSGGRMALAAAVMAQPALIVGVLDGHPWQIDAHMYFFALLATLAALADWRAVLAGTAVVAVHHLSLNVLLPELVYPGGGSFVRTLVHAVVLLVEAAVLSLMCWQRVGLQLQAERRAEQAEAAREAARDADERAAAERAETMALLEREFSAAVARGVEGDFAARVTARFADPAMTRLAEGLNGLFARTDAVLAAMQAQLSAMAQGDLTGEMREGAAGRFRECRLRMNETLAALRALIGGIAAASAGARAAADRIRAGAHDQSESAARQAAAVEETAAALEEIAAAVRSNADLLARAERDAGGVAERTGKGEQAAVRTVEAVRRIENSSGRITEIIALIDGIAFQTNLLALNAAVEAARAGEAGRGFAVVATEVRTLSQRTAEAAASVADLIRESAESVGDGVRLVEQTRAALTEIAGSLSGLTAAVTQVGSAGREQSTGVAEISQAITRIDSATQQNAAVASDAAAAADDLSALVDRLDGMVAGFRIDGARGGAARSAA